MILQTYGLPDPLAGPVFPYPLWIYTGLLGQVGDIVMFSATLRRLKQLKKFGKRRGFAVNSSTMFRLRWNARARRTPS